MIEPHDLGSEHLVLSHFSLATHGFDVRCAAASAAGFDAIGMLHRDYILHTQDRGRPADDLVAEAEANGLRVVEIEVARGWSLATPAGEDTGWMELCLEMASVFGARHLTAMASYEGTTQEVAAGFARLCDRAAESGTLVGLEPIPVQDAFDIATAREIVERANRDNGGICVDSWHLERGGQYWDQLEALPGEMVTSIQINDGSLTPEHDDYIEDCLWNRRLCGDGEFDLMRFVQTLDGIGATAPYSVEIISRDLAAQDPFAVAARMADTTREAILRART